jgi:hypothetical protein
MAREVDPVTKLLLDKKLPQGMDHDAFMWFLKRFEALVRADERSVEREACAKVCETYNKRQCYNDEDMAVAKECAVAIRAIGAASIRENT